MHKSEIATLELVALHTDGRRVPFTLRLDAPEEAPNGEWQCALRLEGLFDDLTPVSGDDSLQALCLALLLTARLLRGFVAGGGRLLDPLGGDEDWPLEAYFGWLGSTSAPAA
jgi:hypothetical protein